MRNSFPTLFLKGMAMGAADMIPGVSGGTIALITGIYNELVNSIRSIDYRAMRLLLIGDISAAWSHINGTFLSTVLAGILTSIIMLARIIEYIMKIYGLLMWSFFSGIIVASVIILFQRYRVVHLYQICYVCLGIISAVVISSFPTLNFSANYAVIFLAGAIAFCAMILPGISGTLLLVAMGVYPTVISAVAHFHWDILIFFSFGGFVGLSTFSRVLSKLLRYHENTLLVTMCGFLIGSLYLVWPWKDSSEVSSTGFVNLWPSQYGVLIDADPHTNMCLLFMVIGLSFVFILNTLGSRQNQNHSPEE
ncbi:MAG: hypothetical protein CMK36_01675 [Porticoccaceae bacterium]|nr:hypothetical protein [Porticoccaceae bacterium]